MGIRGMGAAQRPSRWTRFLGKLRLDNGTKVHAAQPGSLDYTAHSYALNFEDSQKRNASTQPMPKISSPDVREIANGKKQQAKSPLWKRRSVKEPLSLTIRVSPGTRHRMI